MLLIVRFCTAVLSAYVLTLYMPFPPLSFLTLSRCGGESWDESCEEASAWYGRLYALARVLVGFLWVLAWAALELSARGQTWRWRRLLKHLRYGPVAVLLLSYATMVFSDALLIQYSRWQIVRYVHGAASPFEPPSFDLHNDYRGWCGNGHSAHEYALYGPTAAAQFEDPDPAVRARALRASIAVYDWLNDPRDGPSMEVLRMAANDPDPLVRSVAAGYPELLAPRPPP